MSPVFRHGRLRLYLLRLLDEEPRHGYEVIRLLRDKFMGVYAPSPGTIYPRLARLEEEGLVTHDEVDGRKVYRITEAGREELRNRSDELDELEEELSASVTDIVREVKEDVRQTVRNLREELTWAAREMRRTEREAREEGDDLSEAARQEREAARQQRDDLNQAAKQEREATGQQRDDLNQAAKQEQESARQHRDEARRQHDDLRDAMRHVRDAARQVRDQARAAWAEGGGDEPRDAQERARHARDEARDRARSAWEDAGRAWREVIQDMDSTREQVRHARESAWDRAREQARFVRDQAHEHSPHEWSGGWPGWTDWSRWTEWPGPKTPHDLAAFRDLERLARDFVGDLRRVAWDSGAIGSDVLGNLRGIFEDTLERIKDEIFGAGGHAESAPDEHPPSGSAAAPPSGDDSHGS
jgi:DNA-binding PadR family transcriptional regulator